MVIIAHNIRSLHNVGAIFRSADAFGIEKVYLTGFTGTPPRKEINKTALGSQDRINWQYDKDINNIILSLHKDGFKIYGLETGHETTPVDSLLDKSRIALVLGNEVNGIDLELIDKLDGLLHIPMIGHKQSLNVSVAAGIAMYILSKS